MSKKVPKQYTYKGKVFKISKSEGWLVASWKDPNNHGGVTTQGKDIAELKTMIADAADLWDEEDLDARSWFCTYG